MSHSLSFVPNLDNIPTLSIVTWTREWLKESGLENQARDCQQWLDEHFPGTASTLGQGTTWHLDFPSIEEKTRFIMTWL